MNRNLLYQYTSTDAFVGMINGGKALASKRDSIGIEKSLLFWASSVYTMNDPSEMFYGYDKVKEMIERADKKKILTSYYNQIVITDYSEEQKKFFMDHFFNVEKTPYIISFSHSKEVENENDQDEDLFMWSMYGDSGRGIRLGFDTHIAPTIKNGQNSGVLTFPVCYDDDMIDKELYPIVLQQIEDFCNRTETIKESKDIIWEKIIEIASLYTLFCSLIKSPKYKQENEWRVITHSHNNKMSNVKIRTRGALVIPYVEMLVPIKYLREIIIGPCCDNVLQKRNIELALKLYDIDISTIKIKNSQIPYRNI